MHDTDIEDETTTLFMSLEWKYQGKPELITVVEHTDLVGAIYEMQIWSGWWRCSEDAKQTSRC